MSEKGAIYCPVDGAELIANAHGAGEFHACFKCRGLWIPRQFLIALKAKADRMPVVVTTDPLPPIVHDFLLGCPECGARMVERRQDSVPVDVCPSCKAMWLDGDELIHMVKAAEKSRPLVSDASAGLSKAGDWSSGGGVNLDPEDAVSLLEGALGLLVSFLR